MIRLHPLLAFAILLPLSACTGEVSTGSGGGGSGGSGGSGGGCIMDGNVLIPGQSFLAPDGCNSCECQSDGTISCTDMECATGCFYQGQTYSPGQSFPLGDDCGNSCICEGNGEVSCTGIACNVSCSWHGMQYSVGDSFPAGDGCNTCDCEPDGTVICTEVACSGGCTYAGMMYPEGASFPALDGCNTCTCSGGAVGCTTVACACDPEKEWWNHYVATDPAQCAVIDYGCPMSTSGFENDCGCGCTQDPSCPQSFDCQPPATCDVPALQAMCPYSTIAM
jgi:hypothetical protein